MQNGSAYALTGSAIASSAVTGTWLEKPRRGKHPNGGRDIPLAEIERAQLYVLEPIKRKGGFSPQWVTQLLQNTLMPYFVSYIKRADRLEAILSLVMYFQEQLVPKIFARDLHELRLAHETKNMVLSAEMRLRSALYRTESRGNHFREDYPHRNDPEWLAWVQIG
jgi:succinate dehydrogenase/fumarate reductase flavoprotein subunit